MSSYSPTTNEAQAMEKLNVSAEVLKKLKKQGILKYAGHLICNRSIAEYIKGGKGYQQALNTAIVSAINVELMSRFELIKKREKAELQLKELHELGFIDLLYPEKCDKQRHKLFFEREIDKIREATISPICEDYIQEQILEANSIIDSYVFEGTIDYGNGHEKIKEILKSIKSLGLAAPTQKEIDSKIVAVKKEIQALGLSEYHEKIVYDETAHQFRKYAYKTSKEVELAKKIVTLESSIFYYNRLLYALTKTFDIEAEIQKYAFSSKRHNLKELKIEIEQIRLGEVDKYEKFREAESQKIKQIELDNPDILERIYLEKKKLKYKDKIKELRSTSESIQNKKNTGYSDFFKEHQNHTTARNTILSTEQVYKVVNQVRLSFNKQPFKHKQEALAELQNQISWDFNAH